MKKLKMLLSFTMMFVFSVSIFAMPAKENEPDCKINPPEKDNVYCEKTIFIWDFLQPDKRDFCHRKMKPGNNFDEKGFKKDKCFFKDKMETLNLTDKQKEDLKNLKEANIKTMQDLQKEFIEKFKEMNDEFLKETYASKQINSLNKDLQKISSKILDNYIEEKKELRKILSFEQYNKLFKQKNKYDIMAEKLCLTDEQKEKVEQIMEAAKKNVMILKEQIIQKSKSLEEEFNKDNVNKRNINLISNEISEISKNIFNIDIDTKLELKAILSDEQYKKIQDFKFQR